MQSPAPSREVSPQAIMIRLQRKVQWLESEALILQEEVLQKNEEIAKLKAQLPEKVE